MNKYISKFASTFFGGLGILFFTGIFAVPYIIYDFGIKPYIDYFPICYILYGSFLFCYIVICISYTTHEVKIENVREQLKTKKKSIEILQEATNRLERQTAEAAKRVKMSEQRLLYMHSDFQKLLAETEQTYPWLATQIADFMYINDEAEAERLRNKSRPALKAADSLSKIAKEKRQIQLQCKMQEYQLNYYETLFPWLEEFKQCDPKESAAIIAEKPSDFKDEYEVVKNWLSPQEYQQLSTIEKYQLALDRYKHRKKTDWAVGIEYERFIGYFYESQGFRVTYQGALKGKMDMGIDVIASLGDQVCIIQCKRWAKEKTIHEKHIFQLYGSTILYQIEHPNIKARPLLVTTTYLSDVAKKCCEYLKVGYFENYALIDYPVIKCNVSRDKQKIYHLPFDQQYDHVCIDYSEGDFYAFTVAEAESKGFRRAFRWKGQNMT